MHYLETRSRCFNTSFKIPVIFCLVPIKKSPILGFFQPSILEFQPSSSNLLDRCQSRKNSKPPLITIPENWDSIEVNSDKNFPATKNPEVSENSDEEDSEDDSEDSVSSCSHSDSESGTECSGSGSSSTCSSDDDSSTSSYCSDQVRLLLESINRIFTLSLIKAGATEKVTQCIMMSI